MIATKPMALAVLLSTAALAPTCARAATVVPYGGVGQHTTVMNNIHRAQQRNDAAINRVQNNIRSTRPRVY